MKYALSRKWEKHFDCKIIYYFVRPLSSLRRHFASAAKRRERSKHKILYARYILNNGVIIFFD